MKSKNHIKEILVETFFDIGIDQSNITPKTKIMDIIADSLTYISFFSILEEKMEIEMPDEVYSLDIYSLSFKDFGKKLIKLLEG